MGPSDRFTHVMIYWTIWDRYMQVLYLGRAPRTKETLPDFREKCRVSRHSQVFRGLTGSQRTPGFWGITAWYQSLGKRLPWELDGCSYKFSHDTSVTAWYQSLGIQIPRELGFGYPSPLGWFDVDSLGI